VLKQSQFQPMNVIDQVIIIYAGTRGHLDKVDRSKVQAWEKQFLHFMAEQRPQVRATVTDMKTWKKSADGKPLHEGLEEAIAAFQPQFKA
jgi:F-type H+-transporting ATPase subunit alpha